jgi:hypothetical protein
MASRFACIATSRRRRALAASLSSHAVRSRRASASLRRSTGAWQDLGDSRTSLDRADRPGAPRTPERHPLPAIVSRR